MTVEVDLYEELIKILEYGFKRGNKDVTTDELVNLLTEQLRNVYDLAKVV